MQNKNFLEIDNQKNCDFKTFSNKDILLKNFNLSSDWEFLKSLKILRTYEWKIAISMLKNFTKFT